MFHRDYLVRHIQQFTQVLAHVLLLKKEQQYGEALHEIQQAGEQFLGLNLSDAQRYTYDDLLKAVHREGQFQMEEASILAALLQQQGEIYALQYHEQKATYCFEKALYLYLELFSEKSNHQSPDTIARIDSLIDEIDLEEFSYEALYLLFRYFESVGRYAKAEDILFMLAENPQEDLFGAGISFYKHLRMKSRAALRNGGLPSHELTEGLRAFKKRFG